jgi:hypothetical protein
MLNVSCIQYLQVVVDTLLAVLDELWLLPEGPYGADAFQRLSKV